MLSRAERPTAIFAGNDLMAIGCIGAASSMGLRVPQDLSVVGFDDIALAAYTNPPLTTVAQPSELMGRGMAELLLALLAGEDPPHPDLLPTTLVTRQTS